MLGEELAVNYTRQLSIFGYVAVKVGLKFTRDVWFYSDNIILGAVNLQVMRHSVQGEIRTEQDAPCPINAFLYFTHTCGA